jgi:peptide/nickel transport system permease protein
MATSLLSPAPRVRQDSWWDSRIARRFRRNTLAVIGLVIVVAFALMALFAPLIAPPEQACLRDLGGSESASVYNIAGPTFWRAMFRPPETCFIMPRLSFSPIPTPPGQGGRVLGTSNGYDTRYGLVWGARTAFYLGALVIISTLVIGLFIGSIAGYFGGWIDNIFMRFTDIVFAFPGLVLTIVLIAIFGQSLNNIVLSLVLVSWVTYARLVRAEILRIRQLEFVEGARALGARDAWIIFRHVLPNALTPLTVQVTLDMGSIVLAAAALSFLGLGTPLGYSDWGQLINFARGFLQGSPSNPLEYWYVSFYPGLVLILWGLSWNLLGDAVRDALDPRSR